MSTVEALRSAIDPTAGRIAGMIRRMAITLTTKALWQLAGFRSYDGSIETRQAEPFGGMGFYARPPASGAPEAIAVMVGDAKTAVIVATRDEKTRAAVAGDVQPGETMVYNDKACIYVKADGTVEIRLVGGAAIALPTLASVQALTNAYNGHTHVAAGVATSVPSAIAAAPVGTVALKAQ